MEHVLGPKNDPLWVILGVKGQYCQKYIMVVSPLVGKLMTREIDLRQQELILTKPWGHIRGQSS
jgi:hypothetical protein